MVYRVVSTKLTEEEHSKLIDFCNGKGCTPSVFLRESINQMMNTEKPREEPIENPKLEQQNKKLTLHDILRPKKKI